MIYRYQKGMPSVFPKQDLPFCENFLHMMFSEPYQDYVAEPEVTRTFEEELALDHPEMRRRVGAPQLALPGRRMEAIGAVERRLAEDPQDAAAWDLKRQLYADLTEADYNSLAVP